MRKLSFIAIISSIVLLVILTWGYLFLYGAPESTNDVFAKFGIVGRNDGPKFDASNTAADDSLAERDGTASTLRQLTTSLVAGATFVDDDTVRYIEKGTGYLYELTLSSKTETQITNTTFTKIIRATISPNGNRVLLTTEAGDTTRISIGTVVRTDTGDSSFEVTNLPEGASEASFSKDGTGVYYLLKTGQGSEGHMYTLAESEDRILFSLPFGAARVSWGEETYIYTKPTSKLPGYVYKIENGVPMYVRSGALGLTAFGYPGGVVTTEVTSEKSVVSRAYEKNGAEYFLPLGLYPEKCAGTWATSTLICAFDPNINAEYPDNWYKGVVSFEDAFWSVGIEDGNATVLTYPEDEVGRSVDITDMQGNGDGTEFLFTNKKDGTLWLFEPNL